MSCSTITRGHFLSIPQKVSPFPNDDTTQNIWMAESSMVFKFQLVNGEELACHGRREVMQQNKSHKRPPFPPYIYIELWVGVFLSVGAWWATIPVRPLLAASYYERQSLECENWVAYLPATSPFLYDSFAQLCMGFRRDGVFLFSSP